MNTRTMLGWLLLLGLSAVCSQELPSERPKDCDGSSCKGCTPFVPKPGKVTDNLCGIVDVYFPVPIYVVRNDTSPGQELVSKQWACFACCALGCGFDEPQNTCAYDNYSWKEGQTYGCTKCKGGDVLVPNGGNVKTSFADVSTASVYSVINQPYGACAPAGTATPSPPSSVPVEPSPMASPVPSPSPRMPSPEPIEVSPEPDAAPSNTKEPASSPQPTTSSPAPVPSPDAQPEPSPAPFVPISIDSSSPPTPSSSGVRKNIASVTLALVPLLQFIIVFF